MNKFSQVALHALKIAGYVLASALITGLIRYFGAHAQYAVYMPVINIVLAAIVRAFNLDVPDQAAPQVSAQPE
jgi:hypothetical protein